MLKAWRVSAENILKDCLLQRFYKEFLLLLCVGGGVVVMFWGGRGECFVVLVLLV